ncbi:cell wall hydrolase [Brevundimonas sp.]|uniref:cell wall hydrolase n=1 Tax=Brevundimonas sp. TaxID=1871086 RepID=UPI0035B1DAE5
MHRIILTGAAALALAAPALAQTPQAVPGSEEWLRQRGETYHRAPDAEQNPAEVEATARLNAEIAERNETAARTETEAQAAWEADQAKWRAESAAAETARAQWEADAAAAEAARAQYERDRAAWEAEMARCQASGRRCVSTPPTALK